MMCVIMLACTFCMDVISCVHQLLVYPLSVRSATAHRVSNRSNVTKIVEAAEAKARAAALSLHMPSTMFVLTLLPHVDFPPNLTLTGVGAVQ